MVKIPRVAAGAFVIPNAPYIASAFTSIHSLRMPCAPSALHFPRLRGKFTETKLYSTFNAVSDSSSGGSGSTSAQVFDQFLLQYENTLQEGLDRATEFGLSDQEGAFYAMFRAIRKMDSSTNTKLLGLNGTPFFIPHTLLAKAEGASSDGTNKFSSYFQFHHLATALEEDFLDAQVGSTDNRKGWQVSAVSEPTGSSFDDARMTLSQVKAALEVSIYICIFE